MKTLSFAFMLALLSTMAQAKIMLLDVRGDLSTVDGEDFGAWFVNSTEPGRANSEDGIDILAVSGSEVLSWWYFDEMSESFSSEFGPYLLSDGGGYDYNWSSRANQLNVDGLSGSDKVRLYAGYMDWDKVTEDYVDMDLFTAYAYTEAEMSYLDQYTYVQGSIAPPPNHWTPTEWRSMTDSVPEPVCSSLLAVGLCVIAIRRRRR